MKGRKIFSSKIVSFYRVSLITRVGFDMKDIITSLIPYNTQHLHNTQHLQFYTKCQRLFELVLKFQHCLHQVMATKPKHNHRSYWAGGQGAAAPVGRRAITGAAVHPQLHGCLRRRARHAQLFLVWHSRMRFIWCAHLVTEAAP